MILEQEQRRLCGKKLFIDCKRWEQSNLLPAYNKDSHLEPINDNMIKVNKNYICIIDIRRLCAYNSNRLFVHFRGESIWNT